MLYPAWSLWGTCRGCCFRRNGSRTSIYMGNWACRTHSQ